MKIRSITFKLLPFIVGSFILVTAGVSVISRAQLTRIIDESQQAIFEEKLNVIYENLRRAEERLQKTGLVEAYIDDFQASAQNSLENTYFGQPGIGARPMLLDAGSVVVLHPELAAGVPMNRDDGTPLLAEAEPHGQFYATLAGRKTWFIYRQFAPWQWTILYAVPLEEKYGDVKTFSTLLLVTSGVISLVVVIVLSLIVTWLMRPIRLLTGVTRQIASGNLDQNIAIDSNDEIGILAESFDVMRNAVKQQLRLLNEEVAERRKVEAELRVLERNLADIINSMPSAIIGVDGDGRINQWNSTSEERTGLAPEAVYGKRLAEVLPELAEFVPMVSESIHDGKPLRIGKHERRTAAGQVFEDLTVYPLATGSGRGGGAVLRIDNVTKEHELEQQVAHSRKMDAIGQLAGGVAHDFNNMLAGILGAAQLLKVGAGEIKPELLKYIDIIITSSTRAADLTRKLLAFGRKGKVVSTSVDIHGLLDDTVDILKRTIDRKVTLERLFNASDHFTVGDSSGLQNVFMNLGINASHAMKEGGTLVIQTANVWLSEEECQESGLAHGEGEYLQIDFQDNGCGIAPEHLPLIFDPFFTTKEQGKGAGLGLAAAYGTIKDHQGRISVTSKVGHGSIFHILLPVAEPPEQKSEAEAVIAPGSGNVLLVDDEEVIRVTGSHMLTEMGYTVFTAENGAEALEIIERGVPRVDIVIMDMIMPVMDGREAIERIRKLDGELKIIISSGFVKQEYHGWLRNLGLEGFIRKPYHASELSRLMSKAMQARAGNTGSSSTTHSSP